MTDLGLVLSTVAVCVTAQLISREWRMRVKVSAGDFAVEADTIEEAKAALEIAQRAKAGGKP